MASSTKGTGVFLPPAVQAGCEAGAPSSKAPGSGLLFSSKAQTVASLKPRHTPSSQPPAAQQGAQQQSCKNAPDTLGSVQPQPDAAAGAQHGRSSNPSIAGVSKMLPTSPCTLRPGSRWGSSDGSSAELLPQIPLQRLAPPLMTQSLEGTFMPSPGDVGQPPCFWNSVTPVASEQGLARAQGPAAQTAAVCASGGSFGVSAEASGQLLEATGGDLHKQRLPELQMCSRFVPVLDSNSSSVNAAAVSADGFAASGMSMWGDDTSCLPATMWFDSTMSSGHVFHESHLQQLVPMDSLSMDPMPGLAFMAETGAAAAPRPPPETGYNLSGSFAQARSGSSLMSGQLHLDNGLSTTPWAGGSLHHSSASLFAAQDDAATGWVSLPPQGPSRTTAQQQQLLLAATSGVAGGVTSGQHMLLRGAASGSHLFPPIASQALHLVGSNDSVMAAAAPGLAVDLGRTLEVQHLLLPPGHQGVSQTADAPLQRSGQYGSAAEWAAAAQNKLEQLRQVEELKAALKLEILQLLAE